MRICPLSLLRSKGTASWQVQSFSSFHFIDALHWKLSWCNARSERFVRIKSGLDERRELYRVGQWSFTHLAWPFAFLFLFSYGHLRMIVFKKWTRQKLKWAIGSRHALRIYKIQGPLFFLNMVKTRFVAWRIVLFQVQVQQKITGFLRLYHAYNDSAIWHADIFNCLPSIRLRRYTHPRRKHLAFFIHFNEHAGLTKTKIKVYRWDPKCHIGVQSRSLEWRHRHCHACPFCFLFLFFALILQTPSLKKRDM